MHILKNLIVWNKAINLCELLYSIINSFPKSEQFGIVLQMNRCAVSIASNIAENAGRNTQKEFIHFLGIATGSCYELITQSLLQKNKVYR